MKTCSFKDCAREYYAKDFCRPHYMQNRAGKELKPVRKRAGIRKTKEEYLTNWINENEGHTYTNGKYVNYVGFNHPASTNSGITRHHRIVLWDKIGPGEHRCHWDCGRIVSWDVSVMEDIERGLVVDHLDGNGLNNDPENLVPSCQKCNSSISKASRKVFTKCSFEKCERGSAAKGLCLGHYNQSVRLGELKDLRKHLFAERDEFGLVCTSCNEYKPNSEFSIHSTNGKPRSKCKKCMVLITKKNTEDRLARGVECSENDCTSPSLNVGLCKTHYHRKVYALKKS